MSDTARNITSGIRENPCHMNVKFRLYCISDQAVAVSNPPAQLPTNRLHQAPSCVDPTADPPPADLIDPPGPPVILPLGMCELGYRADRRAEDDAARKRPRAPHAAP